MKQMYLILFLSFLFAVPVFSQNYEQVDKKVSQYPKSFSKLSKLSDLINKDFKKPEEKARAIYAWIAMNVSYDVKGMTNTKSTSFSYRTQEEKRQIEKKMEEDLALKTMKKKKAVCQGYSTLYKILCDQTSLECEIITGTSKTTFNDIGKAPGRMDHAWNAVKIKGKWKLVDATWGAGFLDQSTGKFKKKYSGFYFFTDPNKFILKHYPKETKWLLTKGTAKGFANHPLFYRDYFETGMTIQSPTKGLVKMPKNKTLKVVVTNCKKQTAYFAPNSGQAQKVEPTSKGSTCTYEVKIKKTGYLTMYVNNSAFVTFKIVK
jgi:transglutaminase/protease-like cytokinesis protein 3